MKSSWWIGSAAGARALVLLAVLPALVACAPRAAHAPVATAPTAPAIAPPALTDTPALPQPLDPTQPTPIPYAVLEATSVARATASPIAPAAPAVVQDGHPAVARVERGGLQIDLRLPGAAYRAGESGQAVVTFRNASAEVLFIEDDDLTVLDEQGREPEPWPWLARNRVSLRTNQHKLLPGAVFSATHTFQLPPLDAAAGQQYALWAAARLRRALPGGAHPDNISLALEAGPLPLPVEAPDPARQLQARLQVDRAGWRLQATTAVGALPPGPLWGWFEAQYEVANGIELTSGPLRENAAGTWTDAWDQAPLRDGARLTMRAWVGAQGYVVGIATATIAGGVPLPDPAQMPKRQTFAALTAAQAALGLPLHAPARLPAGAIPGPVQVVGQSGDGISQTTVDAAYHLPGGAWLRFVQTITRGGGEWAGWGAARSDPEARRLDVGANPAYAAARLGWWLLDWKSGATGFELSAPLQAVALDDLRAMAGSMAPLP